VPVRLRFGWKMTKTIGLCMIVKDEAHVLRRCLNSPESDRIRIWENSKYALEKLNIPAQVFYQGAEK
jgi:hypothetical protein